MARATYAAIHSVSVTGATAYCAHIIAATASLCSPASSAITATLFAVGVALTIAATRKNGSSSPWG